ncbi:phosphoribosylformylglycinamidine synthase subunit PurS [Pontibacter sp. G13]|uniref:phosphoribosylformylglycinamidine synthase subunit PurS n=1 Tax=Pontibacter sp. G13 TaxID=3074898 RepID=UPI00288A853D|nr:phosphoribosylformylglycinamidine synthase subunit PurS [Pontibacter sp. G13]WNJ16209.1 phosphoribosylformylglycinamidine synthase subunit PurS [Pontibacter sp. G13]
MKFKATIQIMPREEILDPQGKATQLGLHNLGFDGMDAVRIGRRVELVVDADSEEAASATVQEACKKLLANTVIEQFEFEVSAV